MDAEADMENLFAGDDVHMDGGVENTQSLTQEEGGCKILMDLAKYLFLEEQRAEGGANLDVTGAGEVKKRKPVRPQPKLNPERIMGERGIQTIEDMFGDWESKGKGKEFDDLEVVMKRMEHWAHRLFPKLPFDNVLDILANRLGKKKVVQTHVKKIRLGMVTETVHVGGGDEVREEEEEREVERYGEEEQPDVFGELLRRAGGEDVPLPPVQRVGQTGGLTDEQRERIRRNKELAAQKKREKQEREQREAEEDLRRQQEMGDDMDELDEIEREMSAPAATEWSPSISKSQNTAEVVDQNSGKKASEQMENVQIDDACDNEGSRKSVEEKESEELVGLDEMLEQMEEN